jgi:hypothetical protein
MKKGFEVANTNQPMAGAIQMKSGHGELEARGGPLQTHPANAILAYFE